MEQQRRRGKARKALIPTAIVETDKLRAFAQPNQLQHYYGYLFREAMFFPFRFISNV